VARYDRVIPPGGVGKVTLKVDTTGMRGKVTKSARVFSNAANQRTASLYLTINVRNHIIVEPGPKIMLRGIVGEDIERTLRIHAADDRPLKITVVKSNLGSVIDYKLNPKKDGRLYELEVKVKSTGKRISSGFLVLSTNHPEKKELKLPIHVRVNPVLKVIPDKVAFRKRLAAKNQGRTLKQVLTIVNNRGKPFRVEELRYNEAYFQVRLLAPAGRSQRRHQLEVVPLMDELPAGRVGFEDTLIIRTDVILAGELKIPMNIWVETSQ
jgi:hypothetical protein